LLADAFRHRFSTKYCDYETGLYYYGYRFYVPELMRWLNRDPIGERGGLNMYSFCHNHGLGRFDPLGLYEKVAFGAGIAFSMNFSGQGAPHFNAMLIGSLKQSPCEHLRFNADVGIRLMRGGAIGSPRGSDRWIYEIFGAISGTIGKSTGKAVPFYFNGTQWGSALGDTYDSSLSLGQTLYYNSALNEIPRMGLIRLQGGGAFFNYNNDQWAPPYGLGDGDDRGWTGGGALGFSIGDGNFAMMGFDDFTGRADRTYRFSPHKPNEQTQYSKSLNQAQWSIGVSGQYGNFYGGSIDASDRFNVQHWIHSTISPMAGYFEYPTDIQVRLRISGSIAERESK
jgi:RHS repeat-associated protein